MEVNMKDFGRMTSSMAQESGLTLMVHSLLHFSVSEENTVKQYLLAQMALLSIAFITMTWKTYCKGQPQDAGTALG